MSNRSLIENFISGGIGGFFTVATGHPFDTVKVRLQVMPKSPIGGELIFTGAWDCVKKTVKNEGFLALYKGMASPLITAVPLYTIFFGGFAIGRSFQHVKPGEKHTFIQNFTAGAFAGILRLFIVVPSERIKCILQVQLNEKSNKYAGPLDCLKKLYKEGGIRSIYRGTGATIIRDIPAAGAYLSSYEYLKKLFANKENNDSSASPFAALMAGGFAGIAAWTLRLPSDVIKSRLQTAPDGTYPNGMRCVIREILQHEGPKGFFIGFSPIMLRAFPANAACFLGIELTLDFFRILTNCDNCEFSEYRKK